MGKFDSKSDKGIFLGYSTQSNTYRVFNKKTLAIEESIQVIVDDSNINISKIHDHENELSKNLEKCSLEHQDKQSLTYNILNEENVSQGEKEPSFPRERNYMENNKIMGDSFKGIRTRSSIRNECQYVVFL